VSKIEKLEATVQKLYAGVDAGSAEWAAWLGENHVWVVADFASRIAPRHGADPELARAAALLHDIADVHVKSRSPEHQAESLRMGRELMAEAGYDESGIRVVIDDAVRLHSCHGSDRPATPEGKVLSAADAMAHFKSDFYLFATWAFAHDNQKTLPEVKAWVLEKIERDLNVKAFFDDVRAEVRPDYELLKRLFSR
jgi:putative nucleotidyltransferase with HDIG domain